MGVSFNRQRGRLLCVDKTDSELVNRRKTTGTMSTRIFVRKSNASHRLSLRLGGGVGIGLAARSVQSKTISINNRIYSTKDADNGRVAFRSLARWPPHVPET